VTPGCDVVGGVVGTVTSGCDVVGVAEGSVTPGCDVDGGVVGAACAVAAPSSAAADTETAAARACMRILKSFTPEVEWTW
jgi:hypothetical protein